jgi:hypothetical protein
MSGALYWMKDTMGALCVVTPLFSDCSVPNRTVELNDAGGSAALFSKELRAGRSMNSPRRRG